jgi:hypothetical protein
MMDSQTQNQGLSRLGQRVAHEREALTSALIARLTGLQVSNSIHFSTTAPDLFNP